jgi:HSP90 family molecular chaperone
LQKIAQKYSNFINFPISLNGEALNLVKALWSRNKKDISDKEYQDFYEYLTEGTENYKYKLHIASDVPLQLKAILFIP